MPTIDEYIAMNSENELVVDLESRKIDIPDGLTNIGVESDDDVKRLYFRMPKHYGEFDLSEFVIRINYQNANGDGDIYTVTDDEVDGDDIAFTWLIGRHAYAKDGNVIFSLCLKKFAEDGMVIKEINTTTASVRVLDGLETSEAIIQQHPDLIEDILKKAVKSVSGVMPDENGDVKGIVTSDELNAYKNAINTKFNDYVSKDDGDYICDTLISNYIEGYGNENIINFPTLIEEVANCSNNANGYVSANDLLSNINDTIVRSCGVSPTMSFEQSMISVYRHEQDIFELEDRLGDINSILATLTDIEVNANE